MCTTKHEFDEIKRTDLYSQKALLVGSPLMPVCTSIHHFNEAKAHAVQGQQSVPTDNA